MIEIIITPKIDVANTYFIFRDTMEIEVVITQQKTIKTNKPLLPYEVEFIRKNYL
jgi:hypothetical protein